MTTQDFLAELDAYLYGLSPEERESAVNYYREYLEEAGGDADAVMRSLGSPEAVAQRILAELGTRSAYAGSASDAAAASVQAAAYTTPTTKKPRVGLLILLTVLLFPFWITVLALWFGFEAALAGTVIGLAGTAVVAGLESIGYLFDIGLAGETIWYTGISLFALGLTLLLWKPFGLAIKYTTKWTFKGFGKIIRAILGKERA